LSKLHDFRHSLRVLRQAPTLALAAVSTLALAIGANAAVFSVVDKVLVRRLPIERPDRIAVIWPRERANPTTIGEISYATFRAWQDEAQGFQGLAAIGSTNWSLILHEGDPATIPVAAVSGSFFSLLGASAPMGRTLVPEDDQQGSNRVGVMSHGSWVRRFGADPNVVGRRLRFQDAVYTIVGVMPAGFDYPRGAELWVPLVPQLADASKQWNTDVLAEPGFGVLFVLGRLDRHVTFDAARGRVSALIARGAGTAFRPDMEAVLTPLDEHIFGNTRPALVALAACVGLVLLIGCANVAVLLLVRATARAREMAIRLAIGATRWRIVRQSLIDASVLTALGGLVGLGLAYWTIKILMSLAPVDVPRLEAVHFDRRTLAFTWTTSLVTAMLVGLVPGVQASRWNLTQVLNSGSQVVRSRRLRSAFVVAQVGLALVLLVCAGLIGRSFRNLLRIDIGFKPSHVLTLDVTLPNAPADRHNPFYTALLARVRAMPGVEAVGAVFQRPLEHAGIGMDATILLEGQRTELQFRDWEQNPLVNLESVTPEYFRAIGLAVVRGRAFTEADAERAPRVAIISDKLARRLWPGQDAIGKRLLPPGVSPDEQGRPRWATVVGVVHDARYRGLTDLRFDLYLPYLQIPGMPVKHLMVRTSREPLSLVSSIRAEARQLDPSTLIEKVAAMEDLVHRATAPWQFSAWTLGLLSLLALALASLGVYAAVSQSVVERTREIGVRVAVGALPREIVGLVLREGLGLTMAGIGVGLAIAMAVGRILTGLLFEVRPIDPLTLAGMAMLFLVVSAAALVLPAWRAARVDPASALRRE
jgi:putative ABC transport system permease protein